MYFHAKDVFSIRLCLWAPEDSARPIEGEGRRHIVKKIDRPARKRVPFSRADDNGIGFGDQSRRGHDSRY
jgi:hypothetical protein